jgi:flagellin-specific chaperone FliS
MKNRRTEVKMTTKTYEKGEKDPNRLESKPEKLAKIMYEGIVRYIKAKNALKREKSSDFNVDFDRVESVNVLTKDI